MALPVQICFPESNSPPKLSFLSLFYFFFHLVFSYAYADDDESSKDLDSVKNQIKTIDKVIIEKNAGSGVVPYLPLPELGKKKARK